MGKKCCIVFGNKSCISGYSSDKSGIRVIGFLANIEEKTRWVMNLPNVLKVEEVTEHMGICLNHWKKGFETRIGPGGKPRPVHLPIELGNTPKSLVRKKCYLPRSSYCGKRCNFKPTVCYDQRKSEIKREGKSYSFFV